MQAKENVHKIRVRVTAVNMLAASVSPIRWTTQLKRGSKSQTDDEFTLEIWNENENSEKVAATRNVSDV